MEFKTLALESETLEPEFSILPNYPKWSWAINFYEPQFSHLQNEIKV